MTGVAAGALCWPEVAGAVCPAGACVELAPVWAIAPEVSKAPAMKRWSGDVENLSIIRLSHDVGSSQSSAVPKHLAIRPSDKCYPAWNPPFYEAVTFSCLTRILLILLHPTPNQTNRVAIWARSTSVLIREPRTTEAANYKARSSRS